MRQQRLPSLEDLDLAEEERRIIGWTFLDPTLLGKCMSVLRPEDFCVPALPMLRGKRPA